MDFMEENVMKNQCWNNDKWWCGCKKHHICQKDDIWNSATCSCENNKYLARIIDDSIFTWDEIIDVDAGAKSIDKAILEEYKCCKKIMKKHFNKNVIMSEEDEYLFQQSNSCWICKKLVNLEEQHIKVVI